MESDAAADRAALAAVVDTAGAFVVGRRMFDLGIEHWGDDGTFGKPVSVGTTGPRRR